jgi:hypothetical protein
MKKMSKKSHIQQGKNENLQKQGEYQFIIV